MTKTDSIQKNTDCGDWSHPVNIALNGECPCGALGVIDPELSKIEDDDEALDAAYKKFGIEL